MPWPYDDESTGPYGSVSQVPTGEWFGVDTTTGAWQRPGTPTPTLGAVTGAGQGYGVPAPGSPTLGQVTGLGAPPRATPSALPRPPGREPLSAFLPPQPPVWESIARGIGMATPQGREILQGYDQQAQQGLQNRLALRRQQMLEEQEARQGVKDEYSTLVAISQIKNKALRNMQFDRFAARAAEAGTALPPDFIEAYKKSTLAEGEGIAQAYGPLLEKAGFNPTQVTAILEGGDLDTIKGLLEGGLKVRKAGQEEEEAKALQRIQAGGTLGDVSGITPEAGAPPPPQRPRGYVESGTPQPILGREKLTPSFTAKAQQVADRLGMNPQDLLRIISFETGGTFNPAEKNRARSGATGLIQFTRQTAKALGTTTEALAQMSPEEQLDYVEQYLTPYKGKLGNLKDAYLAVLKPAALGQGLDAPLFTKEKDGLAYRQNAGLDTGNKGVVTVGDALAAVMRTTTGGGTLPPAPETRMQVAGSGAPAPTTPAPSGEGQAALARLKSAIATKQQQIQQLSGLSSERANKVADNYRADLKILQDQHDRLEDRLTETPRAVQKATALQPLELAKQRAGAEVTLEAKMNEPIGTENAIKMNLPAETRWKDVPTGTRVLDRPGEGVTTKLGDFKASYEGITRVIGMLDNPKAVSIVGTLLSSEDNAAFRRLAGEWISSVTPAERKFAAALVAEIAGIRNTISGQAVSAQEAEFLKPMLPSVADPDVATIRAKLEVLQEWIARKHEGARTQMDELGFRTPKALPKPAEKPPKDPKEALLEKHTR